MLPRSLVHKHSPCIFGPLAIFKWKALAVGQEVTHLSEVVIGQLLTNDHCTSDRRTCSRVTRSSRQSSNNVTGMNGPYPVLTVTNPDFYAVRPTTPGNKQA